MPDQQAKTHATPQQRNKRSISDSVLKTSDIMPLSFAQSWNFLLIMHNIPYKIFWHGFGPFP